MSHEQEFYYTLRNVTTIEYTEKRESAFAFEGGISTIKDPYDLGTMRNLKAVLGRRWWMWWTPQRMEGDGYEYLILREEEGEEMDKLV
ncbi:Palmitoyltransferase [Rhizophlyctis rosea]|uniref:Palmitoyltransferase n=1 Tax=Rhizophlyctis rosea TaxID=64517 RepID=A0AAD5SJS8_9FUNG|nr:Palmitoyltransferase [Rhizophlyctis rosea]